MALDKATDLAGLEAALLAAARAKQQGGQVGVVRLECGRPRGEEQVSGRGVEAGYGGWSSSCGLRVWD